jgi:hypothetical protein
MKKAPSKMLSEHARLLLRQVRVQQHTDSIDIYKLVKKI